MKTHMLMACLLAAPLLAMAANPAATRQSPLATEQAKRLSEADRKVTMGRILLKWGGYVEKANGQDRRAWAASLWPSLASADLDNLQKASRAVTYEGMRNALLGQRPNDEQVIDALARSNAKVGGSGNPVTKALGSLATDLVFTPITPCRIVDTRAGSDRIGVGETRDLDASNAGGNFAVHGGSGTDCGIPANPAALALSVTGLNNTTTGYLRVYPYNGTNAQGSPVPLTAINTTATNDMIVPTCQGCTQELKVFSTSSTHYAAFVTGYFMAPRATALECVETASAALAVLANSTGAISATACPATFTATSTNCESASQGDTLESFTRGFCRIRAGASPTTIYASRDCCRIPGR